MKLNIKDKLILSWHIIITIVISVVLIGLYHIIVWLTFVYVAIINKFNLKSEDSLLSRIKRIFE
jgi:hypothetical protein